MTNKDLRSAKQQLENIDTVTTNRKELQQLAQLHILDIAGSMRQDSYSTQVLKMVLEKSKKYKTDTQILELRQVNLPIYDPSASNESNNIERVSNALKWADSIILSSPDYHGSMSGAMKNFLDYFWEEFAGKTFGYIVASHEKGLTVVDQMRTAIRQSYGWSMPYNISINGEKDFNSKREIINSALINRIKILARDLSVYGKLIRNQFLIYLSVKLTRYVRKFSIRRSWICSSLVKQKSTANTFGKLLHFKHLKYRAISAMQ